MFLLLRLLLLLQERERARDREAKSCELHLDLFIAGFLVFPAAAAFDWPLSLESRRRLAHRKFICLLD